jgi:hypothetical protein
MCVGTPALLHALCIAVYSDSWRHREVPAEVRTLVRERVREAPARASPCDRVTTPPSHPGAVCAHASGPPAWTLHAGWRRGTHSTR